MRDLQQAFRGHFENKSEEQVQDSWIRVKLRRANNTSEVEAQRCKLIENFVELSKDDLEKERIQAYDYLI